MGIHAEMSGRNDITVGGLKFSGNARYLRDGRLMHHGTILFDADMEKMAMALRVPEDKYVSKGIKSVRARVTNLRAHLPADMTTSQFRSALREHILRRRNMSEYMLTAQDIKGLGIADEVIPEPEGGAHRDFVGAAARLRMALRKHLDDLLLLPRDQLLAERYQKFRKMGVVEGAGKS
jgi:hypothetical protein